MAQKVLVQLVDDLDGTTSDSVSTVQFGLDGVTYEIDLTDSNAEALRGLFTDYVNSGRRTGGRVKRGSGPGRNGSGNNDASQIREWAQANGVELAARGRIPAHVAESYHEAQKDDKAKTGPAKRRSRAKKG